MSGEKIGSLTNNSLRGWGNRMQTGEYLASLPTSSFSSCPGGCGGRVGVRDKVGERLQLALEAGRSLGQSEWRDGLEVRKRDTVVPTPSPSGTSSFLSQASHR